MTINEMKEWVDSASMEELLIKIKHEPPGSPWFDVNKLDFYLLDRLRILRKEDPKAYKEAKEKVDFPTNFKPSTTKMSWDRMNAI